MAGNFEVSYTASVIQKLFDLIVVSKDAKKLPMLRDIELRGTPIFSLVDLIRRPKVFLAYGSDIQKQTDRYMLDHLAELAGPLDKNSADNLNFIE